MFNTKSIRDFINDAVVWINAHEYTESRDNTYTNEKGDLGVTILPEGVSAQAILPVFSVAGKWQMVFEAKRNALTAESIREVVQQVIKEHDIMSCLVRSLGSYGWRVSGTDNDGGYLTAERDGSLIIRVYSDIIDRSVRIEGNGQSLVSMHLNNAGVLKTSNNVPGDSDRYQISNWLIGQYES